MAFINPDSLIASAIPTRNTFLLLLISPVVLYLTIYFVNNLYFHPLTKYPGPFLARSSRLWYLNTMLKGDLSDDIAVAHLKYGDVMRIAPNELSFVHPSAWKDIYSHRPGKPEMMKDPFFYAGVLSRNSVLDAPLERHGEMRRLLSHGFSASALREQYSVIENYVQLLVNQLSSVCDNGKKSLDIVSWWNFLTFDVISDLAFGETFGSLSAGHYHPWVFSLISSLKLSVRGRVIRYLPLFIQPYAMRLFFPADVLEGRKLHAKMTKDRTLKRINNPTSRQDFLVKMAKPDAGVTMAELIGNCSVLTVAGSETTASLLSGLSFYLLKNPAKMAKLKLELNGFASEEEITCEAVQKLKYLGACIEEGLRLFPPVVGSLPRVTGDGGDYIAGEMVPGKTTVSITTWAMFRSPKLFVDPLEFVPERWLGDKKYDSDRRDCVNPFSLGPRNCLGINLAYVEMRLAIAKVFYHFDMEIEPESRKWLTELKTFFVWEKKPMMVRLREVKRSVVKNGRTQEE